MGFAKASDLKRLEREVMELKSLIKSTAKGAPKKSASKKSSKSSKNNSSSKKKSK
jgi:hypothetical protein